VHVTVNGEGCDVEEGTTVAALMRARGARERGSAVAVDGAVVPRGEWERCVLADGQTVELVHAVQGG
jgi:sulfur carrier protein